METRGNVFGGRGRERRGRNVGCHLDVRLSGCALVSAPLFSELVDILERGAVRRQEIEDSLGLEIGKVGNRLPAPFDSELTALLGHTEGLLFEGFVLQH